MGLARFWWSKIYISSLYLAPFRYRSKSCENYSFPMYYIQCTAFNVLHCRPASKLLGVTSRSRAPSARHSLLIHDADLFRKLVYFSFDSNPFDLSQGRTPTRRTPTEATPIDAKLSCGDLPMTDNNNDHLIVWKRLSTSRTCPSYGCNFPIDSIESSFQESWVRMAYCSLDIFSIILDRSVAPIDHNRIQPASQYIEIYRSSMIELV